jgi:diaminohydroxyphosphoribosylaminopyrimidine deaminase/5-amino-6-(5-phosphoribosylamino)uracil reductase
MSFTEDDSLLMSRALELAGRGLGCVEPNPMVGCVLIRHGMVVGEGYHRQFGGPHAEIEALRIAGERARGSTAYVTLEPCCHTGKTGPCTRALIEAGVVRVIAAMRDPFPRVAGGGFAELNAAGIVVEEGLLAEHATLLNAAYLKRLRTGLPWVIAKWAMTLDGKIAAHTGDSQWISGEASRALVHELRGRVDAILVGGGTAKRDDPLLTARPAGPRTALRVVLDTKAHLAGESQLLRTAREVPLLAVVGSAASAQDRERLRAAGAEVFVVHNTDHQQRIHEVLAELSRRDCTNVLVEGGSRVLGSLLDGNMIDEVYAFVAPKLIGGFLAPSPMAGNGLSHMNAALAFDGEWRTSGPDMLYVGRRLTT